MMKEAEPLFKNLPGLPLEYSYKKTSLLRGARTIRYTASEADFSPIPENFFRQPGKDFAVKRYEPNAVITRVEAEEMEDESGVENSTVPPYTPTP